MVRNSILTFAGEPQMLRAHLRRGRRGESIGSPFGHVGRLSDIRPNLSAVIPDFTKALPPGTRESRPRVLTHAQPYRKPRQLH